MYLLINIDEDTYKDIKRGKIYTSVRDVPQESVVAIANGEPIPRELSELLFKQDMRITALAYAHAQYLIKYGVDIEKASLTAVENSAILSKAYHKDYYDALEQIRQIKEIEERQWIPVRERLPEKGIWVLAYCKTKDGYEYQTTLLLSKYDGKWTDDGDDDFCDDVIAWMLLPEPYKEREDK